MRRLFELLTLLWVAVTFTQCGGGGGDAPAPTTPANPLTAAVASVRMTHTAVALGVNQTVVLKAEALAADGTVLPGKSFVFGSANAAIATVSVASAGADTATVRGVAVGNTTVSVTVEGKSTATGITVTGTPLPSIPVSGRVVDGDTQEGIGGARVTYETDHGQAGTLTTAADGSFSFAFASDARATAYVVHATASAAGYVATTLRRAQVRPAGNPIESLQLVRERVAADSTLTGKALDVRTGLGIARAMVTLARGQGATADGGFASVFTDAQGRYAFSALAAGTYTLLASADGYIAGGSRTAVSVAPGATRQQDVGLSPSGTAAEVRIVLTWGRVPADLDAHLTGPNGPGEAGRFHAYWSNRLDPNAAPFAGLDLDDTNGNGPETITVTRLHAGGVYRYSVRDYTNGSAVTAPQELGRSGATVQVYTWDRSITFHVPSRPGNLWTVFEMTGDIANPVITERGEMATTADSDPIP